MVLAQCWLLFRVVRLFALPEKRKRTKPPFVFALLGLDFFHRCLDGKHGDKWGGLFARIECDS